MIKTVVAALKFIETGFNKFYLCYEDTKKKRYWACKRLDTIKWGKQKNKKQKIKFVLFHFKKRKRCGVFSKTI